MNYEQIFKNIDDILWKEAGCSNELDYVEQTSWILFLKYLDDLEIERSDEMALQGKDYSYIIKEEYRWNTWACPKTPSGEIDHKNAMTGGDLSDFVNLKLFPYLKNFKATATTPDTLDLSVKNPNKKEEKHVREPAEIINEMRELNKQAEEILKGV